MSSGDGSTFLSTPNLLAVTTADVNGAAGPVTLALLPVSRCPGAAVTVTDAASMLVPMPRRYAHGSAGAVAKFRGGFWSPYVLTAHPVVRLRAATTLADLRHSASGITAYYNDV